MTRFEFTRLAMGVKARIVLYAPDEQIASVAAAAAYGTIARLDDIMSDYRSGSELMRLGDEAGTGPLVVSDDLFGVLELAQDISKSSGGALDVTVGPLVKLWRLARQSGSLPQDAELRAARNLVGHEKIVLDAQRHTAHLLHPGMKLDLGGIAKGYAAERAVRTLRQRGLPRCLVALAGDIVTGDPPPGPAGWRIAIAENRTSPQASGASSLILANAAISTSGDTEQFIEIAGQRYSHIVDPHTGLGLTNRLAVTVVAPRGELADALASAACVLGTQAGGKLLIRFRHVAGIFFNCGATTLNEAQIIDPAKELRWIGE